MSVTKRSRSKNGKKVIYYRAEVYVRGIRLDSKEFETKSAAHFWHDKQKKVLKGGQSKEIAENCKMLFLDCVNEFLSFSKENIQATTFQVYENRIPYLVDGPLRKLRVSDINSDHVSGWLNWLKKHPTAQNKSRKSFDKEVEILSNVLNWYRAYKNANFQVPITKMHRELARFKRLPKRRDDYFIRPHEVRAWILWLKEHRKPKYWQLATFLILTGCRIGEAAAMKWDAIDFRWKIARVCRTVQWDYHTKQPSLSDFAKTEGSQRLIPLSEDLMNLLTEMRASSNEDGFLFSGKNGEPLKYNAIQSAFNAGFLALGLPWRSTHICRHTFATISLVATRDLGNVQALLGHTKQEMTQKYAKVVAMLDSGSADKTASLFALSENHAINHANSDEQIKNPLLLQGV